jgi:hypothetical protein
VPQEFVRQEVGPLQFERFAGHDAVTNETFDDLRGPKVEHAGGPRVRVGFPLIFGCVVPQGMVAVEVRFEFKQMVAVFRREGDLKSVLVNASVGSDEAEPIGFGLEVNLLEKRVVGRVDPFGLGYRPPRHAVAFKDLADSSRGGAKITRETISVLARFVSVANVGLLGSGELARWTALSSRRYPVALQYLPDGAFIDTKVFTDNISPLASLVAYTQLRFLLVRERPIRAPGDIAPLEKVVKGRRRHVVGFGKRRDILPSFVTLAYLNLLVGSKPSGAMAPDVKGMDSGIGGAMDAALG